MRDQKTGLRRGISNAALAIAVYASASGAQAEAAAVDKGAAAEQQPGQDQANSTTSDATTPVETRKDAKASDIVVVARGQGTRDARIKNLQTVDAVGQKDIDSMPSQNLSDVLKRLPGVQVTYDNGEAQQPNIRGVGYIQTTVDGRETVTAGARALQIGDVPGDIVNSIEVFKTPSADQIEGGIGGLIAIKTKKPFDYSHPSISGQLSSSLDQARGKPLPQGSISAGGSWQTGIGRIGATISYDHTAVLLRSNFFITSYDKSTNVFDINKNGQLGDAADNVIYPNFLLPIEINSRHSRDAIFGSLEWAPTDELTIEGGGLYTKYLDQSQQYSLIATPAGPNSTADESNYTLVPNSPAGLPIVQTGTFANVPLTAQSLYVRPFRDVAQQYASAKWVHDRWTIGAQGDFTQSHNNNDILIFAASGATAPALSYFGATSPGRSSYTVSGVNVTNPASFTSLNYTEILQRDESTGNSQRIDFEFRPDGFLTSIQAGYRRTYRKSTANQAFASTSVTGTLASIPGLSSLSPDGDFAVANPNLFINETGFRSMIGLPSQLPAFSQSSYFELKERTNAFYVRGLYGFELFGVPVDGDIGVRGVWNDNQGSAFAIASSGAATPITNEGKATDWLPSATLRAKLTDRLTLRLSGSKTVARPDFTSLSPGLTLNSDLTGSGGNPNLKSFDAKGFDAGLDWLFAPSGYATVAFFTKTLSGLVQTQIDNETINGLVYRISRPFNGTSDSSFKGVEVNLNKKFVELPGLLAGFGMDANYTYLTSELTNAAGVKTRIPGLATHTLNSSIYYDKGPLLVRLGYTITSNFVNNANYGGLTELGGQEIYGRQDVMDATVQYSLNKNLRITANIMNALQPNVGYYNGYPVTPDNSYKTYRRYQFGVKFNY